MKRRNLKTSIITSIVRPRTVVYLGKDATARPIKIKGMDDLQRLADKYDQSCIVGNRMAQCSTDYYNHTIL